MIRKWLVKNWYVNELGKFIIACIFASIAYCLWQAGTTLENPKGILVLGFSSGLFTIIAVIFIVDICTVLFKVITKKPIYKD